MIKSLSSKAWEFLRSDGAILLWASVVGVLAWLVGVLLKKGVSLMRSDFFQPKLTPVNPIKGLLLTAWFVRKVLGVDHPCHAFRIWLKAASGGHLNNHLA